MTKEEAIEIIKSECYVFNPLNFDRSTMVNTALDMAVKALEQQPCETIKEIPKYYKYDTETEDFLVYRHMYTGHEIHIEKPVPRYKLEQEPCEDAISRKDFIAKIEDIYDGYMLDDGGCYPQNFVDLAEEMPSVQPKQRVAKWNKVPKEYIWYCSNCKERPVMGEPFYDYCPRCGCFMKGKV